MKTNASIRTISLAALLACGAAPALTHAQSAYPTKPIRIVVPTSPGSAADTLARVLAQPLSERLGQTVIVDTRPGAGSIVGTEIVAKAPPDGYTLLIALPALAIHPSIHRTLPYRRRRHRRGVRCLHPQRGGEVGARGEERGDQGGITRPQGHGSSAGFHTRTAGSFREYSTV
jgi:hypothetical protein